MVNLSRIAAGVLVATLSLADSVHASLGGEQVAAHNAHHHAARSQARGLSRLENEAGEAEVEMEKRELEEPQESSTTTALAIRAVGGPKRGLAWSNGDRFDMKQYTKSGKISWYYTWSPWPACKGKGCPVWCPMLWGTKQIDTWKKNVWGKSWECTLGFNEPDINGQAKMSVGDAVYNWRKWIQPVKAYHVSPAVTMSPNGIKWLTNFKNQCQGCDVDAWAFHYYGIDPDDFIKRVKDLRKTFNNKPIWITEFACHNYGDPKRGQCSQAMIKNFMKKATAFLDSTPWIEHYAWFACNAGRPSVPFNQNNMIMGTNGKINDLGRQYIAGN